MDIYFSKRHIPFILLIILFIVYLCTICPSIYVGDSGELTTAAFSLGVPHPSGYPLYTILGKLFCLIPFCNMGFRMNLMSVIFSLGTIWLVYSVIFKITSSIASSVFGAFTLAFTTLFWGQTVSAEVYPLHTFFVILLIRLLIHWDQSRKTHSLAILAFTVGLSFLNHLQTLMILPPVLFFIIATDREDLFNFKNLIIFSILFILAMTVYIYLPIRTQAGAAIHWGDPDNLKNFFDVVSGKGHRAGYVFNKSIADYIIRSKDAFLIIARQFGVILLFAIWGIVKLQSLRWKIFYSGIIVFDFFYTVFLNTVLIEITPFNLPTLIVMAILAGVGISDLLKRCESISIKSHGGLSKITNILCCAVPVIFMVTNYSVCDQSQNYTANEHAVNIFMTIDYGGTVFIDGDNNLFPVIYSRIVERLREDVTLYDRYNLIFKMPYMDDKPGTFVYHGTWNNLLTLLQNKIIEKNLSKKVYFAVFNPPAVPLPDGYHFVTHGILSQVVSDQTKRNKGNRAHVWNYYLTESLEDKFYRDYMTREVTANFHLHKGKDLIMLGGKEVGLKRLKLASQIGYNDDLIHTALSVFFIEMGFFEEAREELEKSMRYSNDQSIVYNNWGYYYSRQGMDDKSIQYFRKAVNATPDNIVYYNNLGSALLKIGDESSALEIFQKSLSINSNQEKIKKLVDEYSLRSEHGE